MVMSPKASEHPSTGLIPMGAAGGDDGNKPPDGNNCNPDPEFQSHPSHVLSPIQKCLQQKRQLLRMLRIKRLWATVTGQTTLARILSDRIMVIEADLLDLETSDPATIQPGLIQAWLAENGQELSVYREIAAGNYSGRQAGTGENNPSSRTTKAATTVKTGQTGQMSGSAARNQGTGSTGGSGSGDDDPLKPSAGQDARNPMVTCSKCDKALNRQELRRVANEESASAFLCSKCLSGTNRNKRAKRIREETEPDLSEPVLKKKKGPGRKRNNLTAAANAPPAKKKKPADTQITDDPLEKVKANIKYELNQEELEKAQTLMEVFKKKNITVKPTFYKLLGFIKRKSFNSFFDSAAAFFGHLSENFKNTGILTGMLNNTKKHIRSFAERSQSELEYLASLDLLTSFSSMNSNKGVPTHKEVNAILGWPEWKNKDGEFNMELFRSFSSMNNGQGLLKHEEVKKLLGWPEWKDRHGKFSMELLRAFSSMNHGRGMLKHGKVKAVLCWPEWKDKNGEFSMELFRAFSSMNSSKGMLRHEKVKEVLSWPEWKDRDGEFNMELFRSFSSMNNGKGVPEYDEVKEILGWPEWKDKDGVFSMLLFRAFSSMNHGQSILKHEEVKEVLNWPEWRDKNGEFNMLLFRAFSSMNSSKGTLKHKKVKEVLNWPEWRDKDGEFSIKLFRSFSSMNNRQGMPKHEPVKKVIGWISCGGAPNHLLLQMMNRLWKSEGLPAIEALQHQETQLKQWLLNEFAKDNSDSESDEVHEYDSDSEDQEDDKFNRQIKTVALYLSTSRPDWSLNWAVLKQFHQFHAKTKTVLMLESLIRLLSSYGGKGVERYLKFDQQDRDFLLCHSVKAVPLNVLSKAIALFSANESRGRFVYFAKRLKSLPDKSQWEQHSARLQQLSGVLKYDYMKRLYWELLQPLTKDDQLRFLDASHAQAVFDLLPSLGALHKLSKEHSSQWLKRLLEACLQLKNHDITKEGIQIIFEALLNTHSLLPLDQDIPEHFLSGMRTTGNNTVEIPVSGLIPSGEQLALSYIAVLMRNLNEMSFTVKRHWLEVEVPGDGVHIYRYPMPQLKIQDETIAISNWSEEQFRIFLKITEVSEHYYLTADQWQKHLNPDDPVYIQRREARLDANKALKAKDAVEVAPFNPLPVHVLATLIKRGMAIKPVAWKSLDHHKERLPESLLGKLKERMETSGTECPDEVKESLFRYLENVQSREAEASEPVSEPEPQNVNPPDDKQEKKAFGSLWLKLDQTEVFSTEILNLLDDYGDEMELMHTVTVLKKAKIDIDNRILEGWRQRACSKIERLKRRDPLLLDIAEDVYQSCQELELLDGCGSIF